MSGEVTRYPALPVECGTRVLLGTKLKQSVKKNVSLHSPVMSVLIELVS